MPNNPNQQSAGCEGAFQTPQGRLLNNEWVEEKLCVEVVERLRNHDSMGALKRLRDAMHWGLAETKQVLNALALSSGVSSQLMPEWAIVSDLHMIHVIHKERVESSGIKFEPGRIDFLLRQGLVEEIDGQVRLTLQAHRLITQIFSPARTKGEALSFSMCFLSYSTKDTAFVERLYRRLSEAGVSLWYAPHDVAPGQHLDEQLANAIRINDRVVLVLSKNSIQSNWVLQEILAARKRERLENRRIIIPISLVAHSELRNWRCLDPDSGEDLALEIRRFFIPSFAGWKSKKAFDATSDSLITALRRFAK